MNNTVKKEKKEHNGGIICLRAIFSVRLPPKIGWLFKSEDLNTLTTWQTSHVTPYSGHFQWSVDVKSLNAQLRQQHSDCMPLELSNLCSTFYSDNRNQA